MRFINLIPNCLAIVATCNALLVNVAWSQEMTMEEASSEANFSTFKTDPSDLYSSESGGFSIDGIEGTISTPEIFGGVAGVSPSGNDLPAVLDYDGLYEERDRLLGTLESGSGRFNATGNNVEADAVGVLLGAENSRSIRGQSFLELSETVVTETDLEDEFPQCTVTIETGSEESSYDNYVTEFCDRLDVEFDDFIAYRSYYPPVREVSLTVQRNGRLICKANGSEIEVDAPQTCSYLGLFYQFPSNATSAASCPADTGGCIKFDFDPSSATDNGNVGTIIRMSERVRVSAARLNVRVAHEDAVVDYNGQTLGPGEGVYVLRELKRTPSATHSLHWQVPTTELVHATVSLTYLTEVNGRRVHSLQAASIENSPCGSTSVTTSGSGSSVYDVPTIYACGLEFHASLSGVNVTRWSVGSDESDRESFAKYTYSVSAERPVYTDAVSEATLRIAFTEEFLTDWSDVNFDFDLYDQMTGVCSIEYQVLETAPENERSNCVRVSTGETDPSVASAIQSAIDRGSSLTIDPSGQVCSDVLKQSPFETIDPLALEIAATTDCTANGRYEASNTCEAYENDSSCTLISETCSDERNGTCVLTEQQYQCGESIPYTSPTVTTVNVCEGDMHCMGGDCYPDQTSSGAESLAEVSARLSAAEMMSADMSCEGDAADAYDQSQCSVFDGEVKMCGEVALGLSNCCKTPSGVSLADYLQLSFALSRLNSVLVEAGHTNMFTSAWSSGENLLRNSWSELKQPLTQAWDSIIGNSTVSGSASSSTAARGLFTAAKQKLTNSAAEFVARTFGDAAANSLFVNTATGGAASSSGALTGNVGLSAGASSVLSAVATAYTIYVIASVLIEILLACSDAELDLGVKRAIKATHTVGRFCSRKILGACVKKKTSYCVFSSPLTRILNEGIREQKGLGWGTPENPDCRGFTVEELQDVDFEAIDLSEWTGMLSTTNMIDYSGDDVVERLTGEGSTLGEGLSGLYERENAIERTTNKFDDLNLDALREDASSDFGRSAIDNNYDED